MNVSGIRSIPALWLLGLLPLAAVAGESSVDRKVPADVLDDPYDKDKAVRAAIEAQDLAISERSGLPPLGIKSITRAK